jgi:MtN3 and saliva related transmembrane protein
MFSADVQSRMAMEEGLPMKQIVAVLFGLGLLGNAALFVPQALAVWRKKSDQGISLITFGGFNVLQGIAIVHGVYQHDLSLILGMVASLITCGAVTCLTLLYRAKRRRVVAEV